jgi:hypothetical protein
MEELIQYRDCKGSQFFEFAYYKTLASNVTGKVIGLQNGYNANFVDPVTGTYEIYFVIDGVPQYGNATGANYAADYPVTINSLQEICNYFNNHPANTVPKDKWVVDNTVGTEGIVIENSTIGSTNHVWLDMVLQHYTTGTADYLTFKATPETIFANVVIPESCRKIELLKELDCEKNLTLTGYEINGTQIIPFDPLLVFNDDRKEFRREVCVTMVDSTTWNVIEVDELTPCGTHVITYLDPATSPMTDVTANVASMLHEGLCWCCDSKNLTTSTIVLPAMISSRSYGSGITGLNYCSDKFTTTTDLQWKFTAYKNGVAILTSYVSPILTSLNAAVTWLNANTQGLFTITATNVGNNRQFDYTMPSDAIADEYLLIITETVTTPSTICGTLNSPQDFSFTNKGISFAANVDIADSIGNPMTWAGRGGWTWNNA